jgi:hypothetical protein
MPEEGVGIRGAEVAATGGAEATPAAAEGMRDVKLMAVLEEDKVEVRGAGDAAAAAAEATEAAVERMRDVDFVAVPEEESAARGAEENAAAGVAQAAPVRVAERGGWLVDCAASERDAEEEEEEVSTPPKYRAVEKGALRTRGLVREPDAQRVSSRIARRGRGVMAGRGDGGGWCLNAS